jgi:hypothetical protein
MYLINEGPFIISFENGILNMLAYNVEALAMWRYSVFRLPGATAD